MPLRRGPSWKLLKAEPPDQCPPYRVTVRRWASVRSVIAWILRRFAGVFLVLYIMAVLSILKAGKESATLDWDLSDSHSQYSYHPRMPQRNDSISDGCHDDLSKISYPEFKTLGNHSMNHLLSAYFDDRAPGNTEIRILGLLDRHAAQPLYCLVTDDRTKKLTAVHGTIQLLKNTIVDRAVSHVSCILHCNVTGVVHHNPCKVLLSHGTSMQSDHITLPVVSLHTPSYSQSSIAVCLPPLPRVIPQNRLVEFIEMTRLLEADQLYIYKYTGDTNVSHANPNVDQILDFYASDNMVTIFPWKLPISDQSVLTALAFQHCLYSNMGRYKYLIFTDLDRYIIPRERRTWKGLLEYLDGNYTSSYSGFCFPAAYFLPDLKFSLNIAASVLRSRWPVPGQMGCILKPGHFEEVVGVHEFRAGKGHHVMDTFDGSALVHWYHDCRVDDLMHWCKKVEKDITALRYRASLIEQYTRVMQALNE